MSWTYDRYGNRLTQVLNGGTQTVNPSATTNRLNLTYDPNGNLTNDGTYGLTWDGENRMVSYAGSSVTNQYDANSLRVRRTKQSGSDVVYVFAGAQPIAEYAPGAAPSSPSVQYVYLGNQLIASKAASSYTFYERDHLSMRGVLADTSPSSPAEQGDLPFGENWYGSNLKWKFTSYERDTDVGDDFAMFRRYQYGYGRFSSPDPVGGSADDPQSLNRYTYVRNDSVSFVDPVGLDLSPCDDWWDFGGGGSGGSDPFGFCPPDKPNCDGGDTTWDSNLLPKGFEPAADQTFRQGLTQYIGNLPWNRIVDGHLWRVVGYTTRWDVKIPILADLGAFDPYQFFTPQGAGFRMGPGSAGGSKNTEPQQQQNPQPTKEQQCRQWTKLNKGLLKLTALQGIGCVVPGGQPFCVSGVVTLVFDVFVVDPLTDRACGN
jgi:RHS repeat-associated protein